ncbi:MAG: phospho-N-acetylmuramoyl-pentapeptide-transferase [Clostridia bacterium]|nr:phospho-N-acetylmuramoyl-pentapeptide-transferase [Clostridia bacterium]
MFIKYLICGLFCLLFASIIAPAVLWLCRKLKAQQSILHYVDKHASKEGTPTMGGLIFLLTLLFATFFLFQEDTYLAWFAVIITLGYGLLGFLDDFIKVHWHHNEGLKPYQKIIGQAGLAIIVALYVFLSNRTSLIFFGWQFDVGWFIIPLVIVVLVATTNSVNLTDGLDGLAGGVTLICSLTFGIILALLGGYENANMAMLCFGLCGGLLGFLMFNCFPAKIFMGDTGSLALGGFISAIAVLSGLELLIPIICIMFVLSAVSDIIQVLHYKRTKKRVFLMAPLHHHFEQKGVHENRIVVVYIVITTAISLAVLIGMFAVGI